MEEIKEDVYHEEPLNNPSQIEPKDKSDSSEEERKDENPFRSVEVRISGHQNQ